MTDHGVVLAEPMLRAYTWRSMDTFDLHLDPGFPIFVPLGPRYGSV